METNLIKSKINNKRIREKHWKADPFPKKKQSHKAKSQWTHCVTICIDLFPSYILHANTDQFHVSTSTVSES